MMRDRTLGLSPYFPAIRIIGRNVKYSSKPALSKNRYFEFPLTVKKFRVQISHGQAFPDRVTISSRGNKTSQMITKPDGLKTASVRIAGINFKRYELLR